MSSGPAAESTGTTAWVISAAEVAEEGDGGGTIADGCGVGGNVAGAGMEKVAGAVGSSASASGGGAGMGGADLDPR